MDDWFRNPAPFGDAGGDGSGAAAVRPFLQFQSWMLDGLAEKDWLAELDDRDYDDEEIATLRSVLRRVARGCRKLTGRHLPVAVSIFFSGKLPPEAVSGIYSGLLTGPEIDVVIVQDGVGTNQWEGKVKEKAGPYLVQLARAIRQAGAHPWVGIEIFATSSAAGPGRDAPRLPAPGSRVAEQLEVAAPLFERSVMFDFFHYMSPLRGEPQAALQRWFAAQPGVK
jgi:hypothetical protein